jgi:extracellular matrix regulatory protein A
MNVGFDNFVPWWRVVAILLPNTAPAERYRDKAEAEGRLVTVCAGRRRRSIIVTDTNQVIISSVSTETLMGRLEAKRIEEDLKLRTDVAITIQNGGQHDKVGVGSEGGG